MAKDLDLQPLKKGISNFNLVGKAKISDYTFKLDTESSKSDSDWVYNQLNLGVDCGKYGIIYADMMGGYGTVRENVVYVHGKKENKDGKEIDDFNNFFQIAWEDRFNQDIIETCGNMCFINVGLESDDNGKTVYKKFLSEYDAIQYISENLVDGMIISVRGNLTYSIYNGNLQTRKEIRSIVLSKAKEEDFKATFKQTVLLDKDSIGKVNKETLTIPITTYILDYTRECNGKPIEYKANGRTKKGTILPFIKVFDFKVSKDTIEEDKKKLKLFKVRGNKITQMGIDGYFSRGNLDTTEITMDDIPDDIKELIELGYVEKDEVLGEVALKNGTKTPEKMVIDKPRIKFTKTDKGNIPSVDKVVDAYEQDDLNIELIFKSLGINAEDEDNEDDILDDAIDEVLDEDTDDDDWLKDL